MGFIHKNNGFVCKNCGEKNPPAKKTCRNHCRKCLYSLHVDDKIPGDRKSKCHGQMKPIAISGNVDNLSIHHKCIKCGKEIKNRIAGDDDMDTLAQVSKNIDNRINV